MKQGHYNSIILPNLQSFPLNGDIRKSMDQDPCETVNFVRGVQRALEPLHTPDFWIVKGVYSVLVKTIHLLF